MDFSSEIKNELSIAAEVLDRAAYNKALRVHLWVKFNSIIVQIPCPAILFAHFHLY